MRYSNRLKYYRQASNLTQRQVATTMGLRDGSLISRWEHDFSLPDLENAFKLSVIYGVIVDALFVDLRRSVQHRNRALARSREVNTNERNKITTLQRQEAYR